MGYYRPLSQTKYINDANLLTYWKLEDTADSKGSMTLTNVGTTTFSAGKFDNAANFGATNTTKCLYASQTSNTTFSVSFWVNLSAWNAAQAIIDKYPSGGWRIWGGTNWSGLLLTFDSTNWAVSWTPTTGQWYHIVMTFNNSTGIALTYIDGLLKDTKTGLTLTDGTQNITLASQNSRSGNFMSGLLDDVSIFSRVLSAAEVADLYQSQTLGEYNGAGSGTTKLLIHLNGSSADSSGNNNNGTDTAITYSQANGKFGVGAGFARASGSNVTWSTASPDITPTNRTISAWFNLASLPANEEYYFINSISKYATGLVYYNNGGTRKAFLYHTDSGGTPTASIPSTGETLSTGVWYNLIGVYNGTTVKSYLNGVEIHSQNISSTYSSGTGDSSIGKWTSGAHYFNGAIDEVIIENVAWSAEKIKKYYTMTKGRFGIL